jgi:hypothetical protein
MRNVSVMPVSLIQEVRASKLFASNRATGSLMLRVSEAVVAQAETATPMATVDIILIYDPSGSASAPNYTSSAVAAGATGMNKVGERCITLPCKSNCPAHNAARITFA